MWWLRDAEAMFNNFNNFDGDDRQRRRAVFAALTLVALFTYRHAAVPAMAATTWSTPLVNGNPVVHNYQAPLTKWGPGHRGIDLEATQNAVVLAPANGYVRFSGKVGVRSVVTIQTGRYVQELEPVCGLKPLGTRVQRGQIVGTVCDSGASHCAPLSCLHWSVRTATGYLSPEFLLGQLRPSRLSA